MALENKLGINDSAELARVEEKISKTKAIRLYESNIVEDFEIGKFSGLSKIHKFLFAELYDFAGKIRTVNIAKGNFRFAPVMYLETALKHIDDMPQSTFDEIIEKYVEMNVAHPFRDAHVIIGTRLEKPSKINGFALLSPNFFMPERGERNHHTSTYIAGQQYESLIAIKATIPSSGDGFEGPKSL